MTKSIEEKNVATLEVPEFEIEEVVMADESGELLTAEQAEHEERRLNLAMNSFFTANPTLTKPILDDFDITEEEDEEEVAPALKEINLTESGQHTMPITKPSLVESAIVHEVVSELIREIREEENRVEDAFGWCSSVLHSSAPIDNLMDAYRKERNHLLSLLHEDEFLLDKAPQHIQTKVKKRVREVVENLTKAHMNGQLENLIEKVNTLEKSLQDSEILLSKMQEHFNELEAK